jgi:outer membrane protein assembly factor BamB
MSTETQHAASRPSIAPVKPAAPPRKVRLWPAFVFVAAYWAAWAFVTVFYPATFQQFMTVFWSPMILAPLVLLWWLGFSRQRWLERFWGVGCVVLAGVGATYLAHTSMMMGMLMYALPVAITAVVLTVAVTREAEARMRWLAVAVASVLAWGYFTLIRVDGVTGRLEAERSWRWTETAEDRFLAARGLHDPKPPLALPELVATESDWPEFRGPKRDGHLRHVSFQTDWTAQPPKQLWGRRVGPGWSSFAVVAERAFTQEQRGEAEAVVCIELATGNEIWSHEDATRFYDVVAGAGPRATPTFHGGKVYAQGGSGKVNCLDAATGKLIWSRDVTEDGKPDAKAEKLKPPLWGYASSPLVVGGVVVVFAGGKEGKSVLAYDAESGELKWSAGKGTHSYSSPQLFTGGGQPQVLMVSERGLEAFDPDSGKLLWEHDWNLKDMFRVCQPHVIGESQVLVGTPMAETRLLSLAKDGETWSAKEEWTSKDLKPYYNDFVRLGDHLYGFDSDILVCIDLASGKKKWKKGRYGHGQALLLGEAGQMLVISDQGEVVLTEVSPQGLKEIAKFKALNGKTWNHPVIAGGKLLVRNGEEMACFELTSTSASN